MSSPAFAIDVDVTITPVDRAMFAHPRWRNVSHALSIATWADDQDDISVAEVKRLEREAFAMVDDLRREVCQALAREVQAANVARRRRPITSGCCRRRGPAHRSARARRCRSSAKRPAAGGADSDGPDPPSSNSVRPHNTRRGCAAPPAATSPRQSRCLRERRP